MKAAYLILASVLFIAPAFSQTATVLLQRATFLEETAGDVDGAIRIYRKMISSGANNHVYEAEAQYRLGACLLKKGDKTSAARMFQDLMQKHPEATKPQVIVNHYVDASGFSVTLPAGWSIHPRAPSKGTGRCADVEDAESQATIGICAKSEETQLESISERLTRGEIERVQLRRKSWRDFTVRPNYPKASALGGRSTLTMVADYTVGKDRMTEWATWVQSETTRSSVMVHVRARDFELFQSRFKPILDTYRIP